jgi:excisionase family DNA binding protein
MDENELLTSAEAADIKGWTSRYIVKLIREGRLAAVKKGGIYLIRRGDLESIKPAERTRGRPPKDKT